MNEDVSDLIGVDEAIRVIDQTPVSPRVISVRLENSQGLRLAEDVLADRDYPPFDKSLMDGYAVRASDVSSTPAELEVIGTLTAGQRPTQHLNPVQAIAIMTGAPIPTGADAVVPIEDVAPLTPSPGTPGEGGDEGSSKTREQYSSAGKNPHPNPLPEYRASGQIQILRAAKVGQAIARRGGDCVAGTVVLKRGAKLESAQLAVAASVGAAQIKVFDCPRVGVLSTGDEIVPFDATPGDAKIRNSNGILLLALLKRFGCEAIDLGMVGDDPAKIREVIERGLKLDALFITGGMSVGQHDYVPKILVDLNVDLKITKLKIKPGKPFVFGQKAEDGIGGNSTFVFGLPGNPVSSFVCALRLCSRLLLRMSGATSLERWIDAKLDSPLEKNGPREFYQPAVLNGSTVTPMKWKGSADIYTLAAANALIRRRENETNLPAGAVVQVLEIPS